MQQINSLILWNFRGIYPKCNQTKIPTLAEWCEETEPDAVLGTESHLTPHILNGELNIKNYQIHRADRATRKKGGVINYIKDCLTAIPLLAYSTDWCEILVLLIPQKNCILCTIYRSPSCEAKNFIPPLDMLRNILQEHQNYDIIVAGDFNFPGIDWTDPLCRKVSTSTVDERIQAIKLLSLTDDFFLKQLITEPTRGKNILDLVFSNITDDLFDCNISKYKTLSDHNLIELKLNAGYNNAPNQEIPRPQQENENQEQTGYTQFNFHKADYNAINSDLSAINWLNQLKDKSVQDQLTRFNDIVLEITGKYTSKKQANYKIYRSKYYKERRALWRKRRRVMSKKDTESRQKLIEEIEIDIKKSHSAERLHNEHQAIEKITTNAKYFYSYANKSRKNREKIGPFINKVTKENISDPAEMAEVLQTQYCSVFSKSDINKVIENIEDFFHDDECELPALNDISFNVKDIEKAIKKIKPHAAAGPDGFPTQLLRECCTELSKPLHIIFRNSLDTGEVPSMLKDAIITPIHKGGLKSDPKNYRPINLISQLIKTFEKVICVKIVTYLEENEQ